MKIGFLLPTVLASGKYSGARIFAPKIAALNLINGLVDAGHDVLLYAAADVESKAQLIAGDQKLIDPPPTYYKIKYRTPEDKQFTTAEIIKRDFEYHLTMKAYQDSLSGRVDIIHSYHDFGAHYFNELTDFPTVYTLHDPLPQNIDDVDYLRFSKFPNHNYISISDSQRKGLLSLNFVATIHHGLNMKLYEFEDNPDDHLIYFGRLIETKGADIAITASRELSIPLHIASSMTGANKELEFYEKCIEPYIDNKNVIMQGYLSGKDLTNFIKKGRAFIFPLRWDEPFGLTMIEAMACGTPVIAFNHGSVSEIVKDGVSGFVVDPNDGIDGLKKAILKIDQIDRKKCREWVEQNFSIEKTVNKHIDLYKNISKKPV